MIVVVIIGLLATLALPMFGRMARNTQASDLANSFRVYAQAFDLYTLEHGAWPADVTPGIVPKGMEGSLPGFADEVLNGCKWDWDFRAAGSEAAVSLHYPHSDHSLMERVDTILDDGDPNRGIFRRIGGHYALALLD